MVLMNTGALLTNADHEANYCPLVGTWKLNVAKSKYSPDPAPKSGTTTIEATADGFKIVADGVNWEGKKTHVEYTAKFDGKDYAEKVLLDGKLDPSGADMVSVRKLDDYTYENTTKLKGKTLVVTKNMFSKDAKTRTQTATGLNAQGKPVNYIEINRIEREWMAKIPRPPLKSLIDHIDHIAKVAGVDHVGLGSDFDGVSGATPQGIDSAAGLPKITQALLDRGYSAENIKKILGGNLLRVFRQVETVSREMQAKPPVH